MLLMQCPYTGPMVFGAWLLLVSLPTQIESVTLTYREVHDTGVFMGDNGTLLGCQLVWVLFVVSWVAFIMFPFFSLLNYMGWFRASESDEVEELDSRYHASTGKLNTQVSPTAWYSQSNQRLRRTLDTIDDFKENASPQHQVTGNNKK